MKLTTLPIVRTAATTMLLLMGMGGAARAVSLTFNDFTDSSSLTLNNDAKIVNKDNKSVLRLTESLPYQGGSAFFTNPISLDTEVSFSSAFDFQISNSMGISDIDGVGADGIAFLLHTVDNKVGNVGGGIGYQGLDNSLAIEFDTYYNWRVEPGDGGNHVGINLNGDINSVVSQHVDTRMNNGGIWSAWVDYDGSSDLLEVRLSQTSDRPDNPLLSYNVDLTSVFGSTDVFVGFSSATGAGYGEHDILAWQFNDSYDPIDDIKTVPEPNSVLALLAVGTLGACAQSRKSQ